MFTLKEMNRHNAYQYTANGPSSTGAEWPRVNSRVALEGRVQPPGRGAANRDQRRRPKAPANAYNMPMPPQGPPEPADQGGNWSTVERNPQTNPNSVAAINEARRNTSARMQSSQLQKWSAENDFTPFNSAVPPQPSNGDGMQSTRLIRSDEAETERYPNPAQDYDPSVPSYAQPGFDPLQPSARADIGVALDQLRDKPERGAIALRQTQDAERHETNAYPHVFKDEPFLQIPQSNLIVNPIPVYISLDSRDRDRDAWPQTNRYRIPFVTGSDDPDIKVTGDRLKNIYSISVLSCVVPNIVGIMDAPYLLLQFDEIEGTYDAPGIPTKNAFTKLYFREAGANKFLRLDKAVGDPSTRVYWPAPRASLDHLTVSFRNFDGTLFDFGADNVKPAEPNVSIQNTLTLEVRTYVTDTAKAIGHRNV